MSTQSLDDRLSKIDADLHNLHNVAGILIEVFDNINCDGKDENGFVIRRFTGQQLNQIWFLLYEMHERAGRLHNDYLETCKMVGGRSMIVLRISLAFFLLRLARGTTVVSLWILPKLKGRYHD